RDNLRSHAFEGDAVLRQHLPLPLRSRPAVAAHRGDDERLRPHPAHLPHHRPHDRGELVDSAAPYRQANPRPGPDALPDLSPPELEVKSPIVLANPAHSRHHDVGSAWGFVHLNTARPWSSMNRIPQ